MKNFVNKYIFLGDSLTHGYGVPDGYGWVELLSLSKVLGNSQIENQGLDGDTLQGMFNRLTQWDLTPDDLVCIMGGTNDILMGRQADYCLNKLKDIVKLVESKGAAVYIGLLPPFDYDCFDQNPIVEAYNQAILLYAEQEGISYLDFYTPLKEASDFGLVAYEGDVHPNELGYKIMFQAAKEVLAR